MPIGLEQTTVWDEKVNDKIYSGTVGLVSETCLKTDIFCDDKTTHGYWNKDHNKPQKGEPAITLDDARDWAKDKNLFNWSVEFYDPSKKPANAFDFKTPKNHNGIFGEDYYTDTGLPPKAGDRIYVRSLIENYHQLAFQLAIEHTKQEIQKLYDATAGIQFPVDALGGGYKALTLHDAFKSINIDSSITYDEFYDKGVSVTLGPS